MCERRAGPLSDILLEDLIDTRVAVHDRNHFEVKLDYSIDSEGDNRYRVESYFFIPRSLGLSSHSYTPAQFYADVQAYIRLKTPASGLSTLLERGPLIACIELLNSDSLSRDESVRALLSNELRLFGSIMRAQIRDRADDITTRLADLGRNGEERSILVADLQVSAERFGQELGEVLEKWRSLRATVHESAFPRSSRETYQFVDEFISLNVETRLSEVIKAIDECPPVKVPFADARREFRARIVAERTYRRGAGYSLDGDNDTHFVYRSGKLKKFVTSVLWLEITKEKEGRRLVNVGSAIAAGVAMLFAVLATILHMHLWLINTSEFVIAAVITYMLKDRIKDWLKNFFAKRVTRVLFDYSVKIRDPVSDLSIGRCREAMRYISIDDVPEAVLEHRRRDAKTLIETEAKPEVVIRYEKEITLDGRAAIERLHTEHFDINDIIRFSLAEFLQRADDPVSSVALLDEENDVVSMVPFRKLYHLNLVMVFSVGKRNEKLATKRVRVVFDKDAIQRLDEVA